MPIVIRESAKTNVEFSRPGAHARMRRTRIVRAEPFLIFRSGTRTLFAAEDDLELLEARDLEELLRVAEEERPDLALVDLNLPPLGGVEAVSRLVELGVADVIVWSFEPAPEAVLRAIRAGAVGYLRKEMPPAALVRALRATRRGEAPLARDFAALLVAEVHGREQREQARERASVLSSREREVLELVARGASNKEIATKLYLSELTVKRHMQNILRKLQVSSRGAAAAFYRSTFVDDEAAGRPRKLAT